MTIRRDTILVRDELIPLSLHRSGDVSVFDGTEVVRLPPHALAILSAFTEPTPFEVGLGRVPTAGSADFLSISHSALRLVELGLLVLAEGGDARASIAADRWTGTEIHLRMLRDRARTEGFREAIARRVQPGAVVVDVGTGTGVLATFAARAGADRVYAIEASSMAAVARRIVDEAGIGDRVEVIRGRSFAVTLPRRADLLVTETIGNDPLSEHILEIVADAKKRLLRPGAAVIPERIDVFAVLCDVGAAARDDRVFTEQNLAALRAAYDVDFGVLAQGASRVTEEYVDIERARSITRLSAPTLLTSIDLRGDVSTRVDASVGLEVIAEGDADGLLLFFRLGLGEGVELLADPERVSADHHWRYPLHFRDPSDHVVPGDVVEARYTHALGRSVVRFERAGQAPAT